MKRVFVLTLVVLFGVAVSARAQERLVSSPTTSSAAAARPAGGIFGKASIERAVTTTIARVPVPATPRANKSFWKGPWPWVIGGGIAAAAIIIASNSSSNDGTGGGIYGKAPIR